MKFSLILLISLFSFQDSSITREELLGQFDPAAHSDFVKISSDYSTKSNIYMRKEAYASFETMEKAAKSDGVTLKIISATRSFNYQKGIWERKWAKTKYMGWQDFDISKDILTYSSMPGTSRHHWGTDIDLNSLDNRYFGRSQGLVEYQWLLKRASEFGYYQSYTSKDSGRTGYEEEKWHWTYLPLSSLYLQAYQRLVSTKDISGFKGSQAADSLDVINKYVKGIEEKLLD